ncbi:MAG: hypothetical protein KDH96_09260, partial [Candidatus Riesia sp.]|nr:hypothetical protein [Candidatus Riesia sp.]
MLPGHLFFYRSVDPPPRKCRQEERAMLFISALVNAMVCGTSIAIPKIMKARCGGENIPGGLWFIRLFYVTAVIHLVKLIGLFYPVAGVDVLGDFSFFLMSSIFLLATNADKGVIDLRSLLRGVEEKSRAQKV